MRLARWAFAAVTVAAIAVGVSGCTTQPVASKPVASPPSPTVRPAVATGTPAPSSPTAAPAGVSVVATGAAANPTGTLVFVIVENGGTTPASGVQVNASAASSNGGAPLRAGAMIPHMGAGEFEAAVIALTVPSGDALGAITASAHAAGRSPYTNPLTASNARFIDDPISPTLSVSVTGATSVRSAVVVAVCWSGSTIVGGALRQHVAVAAGRVGTVTMQAALTAAPSTCTAYARPE